MIYICATSNTFSKKKDPDLSRFDCYISKCFQKNNNQVLMLMFIYSFNVWCIKNWTKHIAKCNYLTIEKKPAQTWNDRLREYPNHAKFRLGDVEASETKRTRELLSNLKNMVRGTQLQATVAINDLLCMKNAGAQIAMDFR